MTKVGDRIRYTGDMANQPNNGAVVKVYSSQFYDNCFDVRFDDGTESLGLTQSAIGPATDRTYRFYFEDEWQELRYAQYREIQEAAMKSRRSE